MVAYKPINKRFGTKVLIATRPQTKYEHKNWLMRCDCGSEEWVQASNIRSSKQITCRCLIHNTASIGEVYGKSVVQQVKKVGNRALLLMKCSCGAARWCANSRVLRGQHSTCFNCVRMRAYHQANIGDKIGKCIVVEKQFNGGHAWLLMKCVVCSKISRKQAHHVIKRNIGCSFCASIKHGNLKYYPHLTEAEIDSIASLKASQRIIGVLN